MLYQLHEFQRTMLAPLTNWANTAANAFSDHNNPVSFIPGAENIAASYKLLYRLSKEYKKPAFGITMVHSHGRDVSVVERTILETPFCKLLRFKRYADDLATITQLKKDPIVLLCAPLSGHHATLLRETVRTLLAEHKVYVTDWVDARMVPCDQGVFHLDDYVQTIQDFIRHIGAENLHIISVCQPSVPVLAAVALMASQGEATPATLTMMGGPIDARKSPTAVNSLATQHTLAWFENNLIFSVPAKYPGMGRKVYPGFLQHAGFVAMNPERHAQSHWDFYLKLRQGHSNDTAAHVKFYDEYNAVLDMDAAYYIDTIKVVFQDFCLPKGTWAVKGELVRPQDIKHTALLTVEGELDDISGSGQTQAAHGICTGISSAHKQHYVAPQCGHYGIFSGRRWNEMIYPQIRDFIRAHIKI
ncbi:MAG: polyhydroxyalkanoate depolymerase [Ottowia sp.]|nr:polyhydroxyalkanoate depolymerase [Ottowia sp.]